MKDNNIAPMYCNINHKFLPVKHRKTYTPTRSPSPSIRCVGRNRSFPDRYIEEHLSHQKPYMVSGFALAGLRDVHSRYEKIGYSLIMTLNTKYLAWTLGEKVRSSV